MGRDAHAESRGGDPLLGVRPEDHDRCVHGHGLCGVRRTLTANVTVGPVEP